MPPVERAPGGTSLIDVLDRVLDKGIVIDAWVRVSLVGIDLITVEARVVVASIDTYLRYAEAMGITAPVARPPALGTREELAPGEDVTLPRPGSAVVPRPPTERPSTG
jgi:gas vesicle structural protein